ncbi:hypothetical protein PVAP13_1NG112888 [Panicum virgatum]|uniref:Uncharacterized protein n=1 Tax=Panicum virgatum TaxID=38727 RepID=A0A8T0WKB5_PANVG|nr:hypothetical protein PVAP13_1NG112888 [Panicum virgatum]
MELVTNGRGFRARGQTPDLCRCKVCRAKENLKTEAFFVSPPFFSLPVFGVPLRAQFEDGTFFPLLVCIILQNNPTLFSSRRPRCKFQNLQVSLFFLPADLEKVVSYYFLHVATPLKFQ